VSYYASNYYRNPGPYYAGPDFDAPVPGWGLLPNIAGAARVGIGQLDPSAVTAQAPSSLRVPPETLQKLQSAGVAGDDGVPWYVWLGVGGAVGVGVAVAQKRGLLRRVGLK
jgi:hypothetical protein